MAERPSIYGLTHKCRDDECHVDGFVKTLRLMDHPADDCGLRDCPRCIKGASRMLDDLLRQQKCPTCGPTTVEQHPRRQGVARCANCKEWLADETVTPSPAAENEGEVRLTEAERDTLADAVVRYTLAKALPAPVRFDRLVPTVERIIAERARVVEGERDAAREVARSNARHFDTAVARAESAEAARAEMVVKLEALADEHERVMDAIVPMPNLAERDSGRKTVRALRALAEAIR